MMFISICVHLVNDVHQIVEAYMSDITEEIPTLVSMSAVNMNQEAK